MTGTNDITIRRSTEADGATLARLAALDSARLAPGPHLIAMSGGSPLAALPVAGGAAVADPFSRSAGAVALLELRRKQLEAARQEKRRSWLRALRPRLLAR